MRRIYFILFLISLSLISCKRDIKNIYSNRIEILQDFENITIYRRGKGISIIFHKDSLVNDYLFEENSSLFSKDTLAFINDSLQFDLKGLNKSYLIKKNGVKDYLQYYFKEMTKYKIKSINSDFRKFGITIEFTTDDYIIFYVADINCIKNSQWLEYINSAHKLDENWYWRKY